VGRRAIEDISEGTALAQERKARILRQPDVGLFKVGVKWRRTDQGSELCSPEQRTSPMLAVSCLLLFPQKLT
jgi:hypothetical protein